MTEALEIAPGARKLPSPPGWPAAGVTGKTVVMQVLAERASSNPPWSRFGRSIVRGIIGSIFGRRQAGGSIFFCLLTF